MKDATVTETPQEKEAPVVKPDVTREMFMATKRTQGRIHTVEAFDGVVYFKEFLPSERDDFEASLVVGKGKNQKVSTKNIRAKMLARAVCDKQGNRIFNDEDVPSIGQMDGKEVEKVYSAIQEVNSISDEDIEELAGNSGSVRSGSGRQ